MMQAPRFDFDESRFPLILLTLRGQLVESDYDAMFKRVEQLMSQRQDFIMVTDLTMLTKVADAKQRQWLATRVNELEQAYGPVGVGSVMIVKSALVRGALTALSWLRRAAHRELWVGSMGEALSAAETLAREAGLSLPPRVSVAVSR